MNYYAIQIAIDCSVRCIYCNWYLFYFM